MERLTQRDTDGQAMMDCQKCEADWTGKHGKPMVDCTALYCRNRLKDRLAAYEDTRLTPESVEALKLSMMGKAITEIKEFNGLPVDRLRELAEGDKGGRLVVLPCKVGDTVYLIVTKRARNYTPEFRFVKKSRPTFLNMERILQDFGKEAFLTREEAKKALEAMEDD